MDQKRHSEAGGRATLSVVLLVLLLLFLAIPAQARQVRVLASGSCAILNMTPEQAQALALRRARSLAVEKAAGVAVTGSTLVTDGKMAGEFIKSFSQGYVIEEKATWEPPGFYQSAPDQPQLVEYRVSLDALVEVPEGQRPSLGLHASLNRYVFRANTDKLVLTATTTATARLAVFNIMADDRVVMLYPDLSTPEVRTAKGGQFILPDPHKGGSLYVGNLEGHNTDVEAIMVAALPGDVKMRWSDVFVADTPLPLTHFFRRYAQFAAHSEDVILSYEVFSK